MPKRQTLLELEENSFTCVRVDHVDDGGEVIGVISELQDHLEDTGTQWQVQIKLI